MFRVLSLLVIVLSLGGCASLSYPLPKCDGYAKRPLNRSMWNWEAGKAGAQQQQTNATTSTPVTPLSFADDPPNRQQPTAFASFNEAASYRSCSAG